MTNVKPSPEDIEALIELIEWYRDDYFRNGAMNDMCNQYIAELQDSNLTQEKFDTIELIVDMWID